MMSEPICAAQVWDKDAADMATCGRPIRDQAYLCQRCTRNLERLLAEIPALSDDLDVTITRQAKLGGGRASGREDDRQTLDRPDLGVHVQALAFNDTAAEVLAVLRNTCVGWVRLVVEERGDPWPADTVPDMGRWLLARLDWVKHRRDAPEALDEFSAITRTARQSIDRHPTRTRFPVGPCPEKDHEGAPCPGEIRAHFPTDADEPPTMTCTACATVYPPIQWLRAGTRIRHMTEATEVGKPHAVEGQDWNGRSGLRAG